MQYLVSKNTIAVFPSDVPGPVGIPLTTENLSVDSCKLNWFFPENDGGSPISNFIIEKREAERKAWTSVYFTASRQNAVARGLTPGKSYFFRVAAENAIGIGPFVETAAEVIIKEPMSESHTTLIAAMKFCRKWKCTQIFFNLVEGEKK